MIFGKMSISSTLFFIIWLIDFILGIVYTIYVVENIDNQKGTGFPLSRE
jgi:hypothetical protein